MTICEKHQKVIDSLKKVPGSRLLLEYQNLLVFFSVICHNKEEGQSNEGKEKYFGERIAIVHYELQRRLLAYEMTKTPHEDQKTS